VNVKSQIVLKKCSPVTMYREVGLHLWQVFPIGLMPTTRSRGTQIRFDPEASLRIPYPGWWWQPTRIYSIATPRVSIFQSESHAMQKHHPPISLYTPFSPFPLQAHSNSHTITMHHQHRRTPSTQHLQIPKIPSTGLHAPTRPLNRTRQRRKHNRSMFTLTSHQLIENQMLSPTRQVVKTDWEGLSRVH